MESLCNNVSGIIIMESLSNNVSGNYNNGKFI